MSNSNGGGQGLNGQSTSSNGGQNDDLASFFEHNKADFMKALDDGSSLEGWVIVMGNEAGDLDSIASAIGYAYFASQTASSSTSATSSTSPYRYVPLYQTEKADLHLRPENTEAFKRSNIDAGSQILFLDDLKGQESKLSSRGVKYALVDANNIGPRFHDDSTSQAHKGDMVIGIIDHHEDLGFFRNAKPRWIQVPTGSCASLVMEYFYPLLNDSNKNVPAHLADLLISAIIIDTDNGKPAPKGKAVDTDLAALSDLVPLSSFVASSSDTISIASVDSQSNGSTQILASWHATLVDKKYDLSPLQGRDLLRRDYKEYESELKHIRYGLSSVPMALQDWLDRREIGGKWENILIEMEDWGKERELDIVGVLTSYLQTKKDGTTKKRREHLYLVRERLDNQPVPPETLKSVFSHLEKDATLDLDELRIGNPTFAESSEWNSRVFTYEQKITQATRKQVAPAMKKAIELVEH
ncbi:DHH phosphoesterase [Cystobasidium minutum MCA 4210]|uniref:DHH phosphoesterase n=1 Tax=Cystobasidium minutum MCA 4210 TaxID=1397322 RepID=UPI0034CF1F04|eukprot:jgi/Rhomi1/170380/fgenesh1_kg.4_\